MSTEYRERRVLVSVRLPPRTKQRVQEIATARGETLTEVVERGLDVYIARHG